MLAGKKRMLVSSPTELLQLRRPGSDVPTAAIDFREWPTYREGMALHRTKLCLLLLFIGSSVSASNSPDEIQQVAVRMVAARQKVMQQAATAADVDAFLAFSTDNLTYEDPVVKMKIEGKQEIRKGMLAFLGVSRNARIVVTKRMAVANIVVFEQTVSFEEKQEDNSWKGRRRDQLTIFEFEGSKVRRIADYWSR
jgi:hypothetical protein